MRKDSSNLINNESILCEITEFEKHLAHTLLNTGGDRLQIRNKVLSLCLNADLFTYQDEKLLTKKYQWFVDVIDINIKLIFLLELSESNKHKGSIKALNESIDAKASIIVKDIARRITLTSMPYPTTNHKRKNNN